MALVTSRREICAGIEVARVTVNRPEKLNALNSAVLAGLSRAFADLAAETGRDAGPRVVVLTGAGPRAFVVGADIAEMARFDRASARIFITALHGVMHQMRALPVPVIARVNGYCLGAGMELAAACDMRIAADSAIFGMPETRVGLPSVIEAALLPGLIGWGKASRLVLTGETIDAATADRWGFVEDLAPAAGLDAAVDAMLARLAETGPRAVALQKRLLRHWESLGLEDAIQAGIDSLAAAFETEEPTRRLAAFTDRSRR